MLEAVARYRPNRRVHTHASESRGETIVRRDRRPEHRLPDAGCHSPPRADCTGAASEERPLAARDVKAPPWLEPKLGTGVAPIVELQRAGISVSLGADGAACNNRLDMFDEMRLAATLQAMRVGPGVLPARDVVWMATAAARTLGLEHEIGPVEVGKKADLIRVLPTSTAPRPDFDPYSTLVYAARGSDVHTTIVDGEPSC
jgi:5-methylthioadenosine/S-adenosylhomocysteine deaminase